MHSLNKKTKQLVKLLSEILTASEINKKRVLLSGGFALEIEAVNERNNSVITRNHDDIDIHPLEKDIVFWKRWFVNKKFIIGTNYEIKDKSKAFVAHSPNSTFDNNLPEEAFHIDVYSINVDRCGTISDSIFGVKRIWRNINWYKDVKTLLWKKQIVHILDHKFILSYKKEVAKNIKKPLRKKDIHDLKLFSNH